MEKHIKSLFNNDKLIELKKQSGINSDVKLLRGFENLVYEFEENGKSYIYRVSNTARRTKNEIKGELEFLNFLYENEIPVARPLKFEGGEEIAEVKAGDKIEDKSFVGVIFERAKGEKPNKATFTKEVIRRIGEVTGKMHRLTNSFEPSDEKFRRQLWEKDYIDLAEKNFRKNETELREKWDDNFRTLQNISKGKDETGLIHTDIHSGNFFIHGENKNEVTIFDFDDLCYYHFVNDIAMSAYYYVMMEKTKKEKTEKAKYFLTEYLEGYNKFYNAQQDWFKYLPVMFKQREFVVYLVLNRTMDEQWLKGDGKDFMDEYFFNLSNDIPYINETLLI